MKKKILSMILCLYLITGVVAGCGQADDVPASGSAKESQGLNYFEEKLEMTTPEPTEEPEPELYTVTPEDMAINVQRLAYLVVQYSDKMYVDNKRSKFEILEEVSAGTLSSVYGLGATNSAIHVSEDLDVDRMNNFIEYFINRQRDDIGSITFDVLDSNIRGSFVYYADTDAVATVVYKATCYFKGDRGSTSERFKVDFVVNSSDPTDWLIYDIDPYSKYRYNNDGTVRDYPAITERLKNEDGSVSKLVQAGTQIDGGEYHGLSWVYTDANELIITGNLEKGYPEISESTIGETLVWNNSAEIPWLKYAGDVKTAILSFSGAESLRSFFGCKRDYSDGMFMWSKLTSVEISDLDCSEVTDMSAMFDYCISLVDIDLHGIDTSKVNNMSSMFSHCTSLVDIDLHGLNTSNVRYMHGMFSHCESLASVDMRELDTGKVERMDSMFQYCTSLVDIDLHEVDTGSLKNISRMFWGCTSLESVNMNGWDTEIVTKIKEGIEANGIKNVTYK